MRCSWWSAWRSHSSPQLRHAWRQASTRARLRLASYSTWRDMPRAASRPCGDLAVALVAIPTSRRRARATALTGEQLDRVGAAHPVEPTSSALGLIPVEAHFPEDLDEAVAGLL